MKKKKIIKRLECLERQVRMLADKIPLTFEPHFNEVISEETNTIEAGKWYKATEPADCLWFVEEISLEGDPILRGYGFLNGTWRNPHEISYSGHNVKWMKNRMVPATESEVFEALKAEAEKRGFKEGNFTPVRSHSNECFTGWSYLSGINALFSAPTGNGGYVVFEKGQWATIIFQPEAIDFSKAGQLVESKKWGCVIMTSGKQTPHHFTGTYVVTKKDDIGKTFDSIIKEGLILCTEPVTLKNE